MGAGDGGSGICSKERQTGFSFRLDLKTKENDRIKESFG